MKATKSTPPIPLSHAAPTADRLVYAPALLATLDMAEAYGVARGPVLRAAGIDEKLVGMPDARVSFAQYNRLHEVLAERTEDPDFALLSGRLAHLENVHVLLYMCGTARHLRDWLNLMPSHSKLVGDVGTMRVAREHQHFVLQWHPVRPLHPGRCPLTDSLLCASVIQMGSFCVLPVEPTRIDLTYPRPRDISRLQSMLGPNLHFNQPVSGLHYPLHVLDYRMARVSTGFYDGVAEEFSRRFSDSGSLHDPFSLALYAEIRRQLLQGKCSLESIARELRVSRRTLQRRLSERGTNFQQLLQGIKYELAKHLLADKKLSVIEIAFLLGYGDPSTFSAAFKSWHGHTPTEYRRSA